MSISRIVPGIGHINRIGPIKDLGVPIVEERLREIANETCVDTDNESYLRTTSIYCLLARFHARLTQYLKAEESESLSKLRQILQQTIRIEYYCPDFTVTEDDVCNLFAIHALCPHGTASGASVFVPDLAFPARFIWTFHDEKYELTQHSIDSTGRYLADRECHLCDSLFDVLDRAKEPNQGGETLTVAAIPTGFVGYRSLRARHSDVPLVANHRLLAASASRRGLAAPIIKSIFPRPRWEKFEEPVKEFLLQAGELVGTSKCQPLYPNLPTADEFQDLCRMGIGRLGTLDGFSAILYLPPHQDQLFEDLQRHADKHNVALSKLGVRDAVKTGIENYKASIQGSQAPPWALDFAFALDELRSALFDKDVEQSLHLRQTLDLYPLHKRVLGLMEYIILPRLEARGLKGNASSVWTQAFTGEIDNNNGKQKRPGLCAAVWPRWPDKLATLETEGNWLRHAADHETSGRTGPIHLAALLDGIVARMSSADEVEGISVNLQPSTAQEHARQLAALADRSSHSAACMTLYLGKIALMLRNAVEHGTDCVVSGGLLLETPGYWTEERGRNNRCPVPKWLRRTARTAQWKSRRSLVSALWRSRSLPGRVPSAANAFLLTPASLHRCLTLLSLVMHGAFSQLQI